MTALTLTNVNKSFGDVHVLKDINLDVEEGEFVVFVGPSGCGKSTLLRVIAGLEDATSGEIRIGGDLVNQTPPSKRGIAMVFQSYALYPHLNVRGNMTLALKQEGQPKTVIAERVAKASQMLNLEPYLDRYPSELSGGQRQRVAIGRAIVREPQLFLFDEPLSNLDAALRVEMRYEIAKLHQSLKRTMIYVTHDQVEAMTLADRIVVLEFGTIAQVGSPRELYERPANLFVAQFIGSPKMNVMPCSTDGGSYRLEGGRGGGYTGDHPAVKLGIRPEHITIGAAGTGQCDGTVDVLEYLGADTFVIIDGGPLGQITVRSDSDTQLKSGEPVGLAFAAEHLHFFDGNDQAIAKPQS